MFCFDGYFFQTVVTYWVAYKAKFECVSASIYNKLHRKYTSSNTAELGVMFYSTLFLKKKRQNKNIFVRGKTGEVGGRRSQQKSASFWQSSSWKSSNCTPLFSNIILWGRQCGLSWQSIPPLQDCCSWPQTVLHMGSLHTNTLFTVNMYRITITLHSFVILTPTWSQSHRVWQVMNSYRTQMAP